MVLPGEEVNHPLTAAALVRAGLAQEVLIPQNPLSADVKDGMTPPTVQQTGRVLGHRGIPNDRIGRIGSANRTTFDEARALAEFLSHQDKKAAVATSAFHTRRTRFTFRKVCGESGRDVRVIAAPNPGFRTERWWEQREGVWLILTEYLKLGFDDVRYVGIRLWGTVGVILGCLTGWRFLTISRRRTGSGTTETDRQSRSEAAAGHSAATGN